MTGSGADGLEDGAEEAAACEACGIDDGSDIRLALGGPHGTVAVGDLPLNHGGAQQAFGAVVRGFDRTGIVEEDQQLVAGSADLGLELSGQVTTARRGQDSTVAAGPGFGAWPRGSRPPGW